MSVLKLLHYPDRRLRKIAKPVVKVSDVIRKIVNDMFDTMYANQGIGLAATQIDIHQQIIVIDISENKNQRLVLINPELIDKSGRICMKEGCLSIPNQREFIYRAEKIKVRSLNIDGTLCDIEGNKLLAICIQHEMDHLVGKLFIDYLSPFKRQLIKQKLKNRTNIFFNTSRK